MDIDNGWIPVEKARGRAGLPIYIGTSYFKERKRMTLSPDSQTLLLLCSHLGLSSASEYAPMTLKNWNPLAKKLLSISKRPADLLELDKEELKYLLEITEEEAERIGTPSSKDWNRCKLSWNASTLWELMCLPSRCRLSFTIQAAPEGKLPHRFLFTLERKIF
jgi:hypothetical protein